MFRSRHASLVVIPDYKKFYDGCIDEKSADAFTLIDTMHQWKVEAVATHAQYFPMVLKLRIEITALTKVIEFDKKCKSEHAFLQSGRQPV